MKKYTLLFALLFLGFRGFCQAVLIDSTHSYSMVISGEGIKRKKWFTLYKKDYYNFSGEVIRVIDFDTRIPKRATHIISYKNGEIIWEEYYPQGKFTLREYKNKKEPGQVSGPYLNQF